MIKRKITAVLQQMANQFKAVAVTGPRQSGKTTLTRLCFPEKAYVSLETPDERLMAIEDPRRFLDRFPQGCILDEVQRAPELFSYLQERLDDSRETGQFILTGSQQFGMMERISQTLAGRIGLLNLPPFSYGELEDADVQPKTLDETLWSGGYPPIYDQGVDPVLWLDAYISTYVERDVRQIVNVQDTHQFQRFLALCAGNVGQLFNASRLGADCGLHHGTVNKWVSVLEQSSLCFRLTPHHRNFRKRLVKTPKVYFWDTGLAVRLLRIESAKQLTTHPLRGVLFENWVVSELLKGRMNRGKRSNLFFWRNHVGLEVDVIAEHAEGLHPVEIKSGSTIASDWTDGLEKWLTLAGKESAQPTVVYGGDRAWERNGIRFIPWREIADLSREI